MILWTHVIIMCQNSQMSSRPHGPIFWMTNTWKSLICLAIWKSHVRSSLTSAESPCKASDSISIAYSLASFGIITPSCFKQVALNHQKEENLYSLYKLQNLSIKCNIGICLIWYTDMRFETFLHFVPNWLGIITAHCLLTLLVQCLLRPVVQGTHMSRLVQ